MRYVLLGVLTALLGAEDAADLRAQAARTLGTPDPASIITPSGFPATTAEIDLGRTLFFDPRLSGDGTRSCATCHDPDRGLGDGRPRGRGVHDLPRHTPSLYNLAWAPVLFWDGRSPSLEHQALQPIQAADEMAMPLPNLVARLNAVQDYRAASTAAFGDAALTAERVATALAAFERTLVVRATAYDRWQAGEATALSPAAQRGLRIFLDKADCVACHSGPTFTDFSFHRLTAVGTDRGRAAIVPGAAAEGAFKTPGLRNVALSAPYFHDGRFATLTDVLHFYNRGGDPGADPLLHPLGLTASDISDVVTFLEALTEPLTIPRPPLH